MASLNGAFVRPRVISFTTRAISRSVGTCAAIKMATNHRPNDFLVERRGDTRQRAKSIRVLALFVPRTTNSTG